MVVVHSVSAVIPFGSVPLPGFVEQIFNFFYRVWPFPTYRMLSEFHSLSVLKILNKFFEVSLMALYLFDLLPKILLWKKPLIWKLTNALIVFLMVLQVPLSLMVFDFDVTELKVRMASVSLSFLLLFEILQFRDRRINRQRQQLEPPLRRIYRQVPESLLQAYTWDEIALHDRPDSCWVVIHGKVYDVTDFLSRHPGGDLILDGAGGDCTPYWESYHPLSLTERGPPRKYQIGYVQDYSPFYSWDGDFYRTVKQRVEAHLPAKQRRFHWFFWAKAIFILLALVYSYYKFITVHSALWAIILGFFASQVGVGIQHDGNHQGASSNKHINNIAGWTLNLIGSSAIIYKRSHDFGHHGCVNHVELDRAYDTTYPIFRLHPSLPYLPMHKYQHWYMFLMYGTVNFGDIMGQFDELNYFSNYPVRRGYISRTAVTVQFLTAIWLEVLTIFLPWYYYGFFQAVSMMLLMHFVFSSGYAWFFAVNHWTKEAGVVDYNNISKSNWGLLQVENSTNYSSYSWWAAQISGGLNLQVEHHLFPGYCHARLLEIQPIVERTCKEFGIRYYNFPSFWAALKSHHEALKDVARP